LVPSLFPNPPRSQNQATGPRDKPPFPSEALDFTKTKSKDQKLEIGAAPKVRPRADHFRKAKWGKVQREAILENFPFSRDYKIPPAALLLLLLLLAVLL